MLLAVVLAAQGFAPRVPPSLSRTGVYTPSVARTSLPGKSFDLTAALPEMLAYRDYSPTILTTPFLGSALGVGARRALGPSMSAAAIAVIVPSVVLLLAPNAVRALGAYILDVADRIHAVKRAVDAYTMRLSQYGLQQQQQQQQPSPVYARATPPPQMYKDRLAKPLRSDAGDRFLGQLQMQQGLAASFRNTIKAPEDAMDELDPDNLTEFYN